MFRSSIPLCLGSLLIVLGVRAQEPTSGFGIRVTAVLSEIDGTLELERSILSQFKSQLQARQVRVGGDYQKILLIDARESEFGGQKRIVLSVSEMDALPEEVLTRGAEGEFFYLSAKWAKPGAYPGEGKLVREYVSRDWLEQYWAVRNQSLLILEPQEVENAIREFVLELAT